MTESSQMKLVIKLRAPTPIVRDVRPYQTIMSPLSCLFYRHLVLALRPRPTPPGVLMILSPSQKNQ